MSTLEKPYLQIEMENGELWGVPLRVIADDRAKHYADDPDSSYDEEFKYTMEDDFEACDWAANNMNWSDVEKHAVRLPSKTRKVDYQEGWMNGEKEIVR